MSPGPRHGPGRPVHAANPADLPPRSEAGSDVDQHIDKHVDQHIDEKESPVTLSLPTAADTFAFGRRLADVLRAGDLIVLVGPLGAGKTALTQGIGAGLGVLGAVVSPTFVISRVHPGGRLPLVHVDAYRLGSHIEVEDLDLDVDVADSVLVIEWGEGLVEQLTDSWLVVELERDDASEERRATLHPNGGDWAQRIAGLG